MKPQAVCLEPRTLLLPVVAIARLGLPFIFYCCLPCHSQVSDLKLQ